MTTPTTYAYDGVGGKVKTQILNCPAETNVMIGIEGSNSLISAGGAERITDELGHYGDGQEQLARVPP